MRLRQIEVFRAVMIAGSVSEAARMLSVSQPVVSRVLKHTELALGLSLFERVRGRLVPTPEAQALFAQIRHAWGELERVDALAVNLRRGASGLLRVAATPSLATSLLPDALVELRAGQSEIECDLWASHTREIVEHLIAFEVDAGFAIEPQPHVALTVTPLAQGELVLAAPRAWSEGVLRLHERAWLNGRPFIALAEATPLGERLAALLAGSDWSPARALRVQTYALAGTLVARGLGYAFLDSFTAASLDPERVVLLRLAPRVTFDLCMLCSAATPRSVLIGRLESSLRTTVRALAARLESHLSARPVRLD
jgi:DNA-binding transcriptional LysR family regulator